MVASSFARLHIAPLQARQELTWSLQGTKDGRRLHWAAINKESLAWIMETLVHSDEVPALPPSDGMLHTTRNVKPFRGACQDAISGELSPRVW